MEAAFWMLVCLMAQAIRRLNGADILLAAMPQGKSHIGSFMPLLLELTREGHSVSVYSETYEPMSLPANITERFIHISEHRNPFVDFSYETTMWHERFNFDTIRFPFLFGSRSCAHVLTDHRAQFDALVQHNWSLVLTDALFAPCAYAIAELSHAQHVVIHSSDVESAHGVLKGMARNYITMPRYFLPFDNPEYEISKFSDRLLATYEWFGTTFTILVLANGYMQRSLAPVLPEFTFGKYIASSAMSLTDMPLQLYVPMSTNNEIFSYGAYCETSKRISGDWEEFLSDPDSRGIILVAFGTIVQWKSAPAEKLRAFVDAFNRLKDYRIVWAYNGAPLAVEPHVRLASWVPQVDILNDPRTKLFISHGGLKSVKEAACARVPSLFMPMFAEQVRNTWLTRYHGYGRMINKRNVTADSLFNDIHEVLDNPVYRINAEKLHSIYLDTPIGALEEGAFRVNRLIRYGGRMPEYFYTRATKIPFIPYLNIDIILLHPLIVITFLSFR